jgi:hypothetical protein
MRWMDTGLGRQRAWPWTRYADSADFPSNVNLLTGAGVLLGVCDPRLAGTASATSGQKKPTPVFAASRQYFAIRLAIKMRRPRPHC